MITRCVMVWLLLLALNKVSAAETLVNEQVPLSSTEFLAVAHPSQLQLAVVKDSEDSFRPAIQLSATNADGSFRVIAKIYAGKLVGSGPQSQAELNAAVQKLSSPYVDGSVEKTNNVQVFKMTADGSLGAYETLTDASLVGVSHPPAGQYRVIMVSLISLNGYLFTIRGGTDDQAGADFQAALSVLSSLRIETKPASQPGAGSP